MGGAALVAALLFCAGLPALRAPSPAADELVYLRYAWSLHAYGLFGQARSTRDAPEPSAAITPGYPAFVAAVMALSPRLAEGVGAVVDAKNVSGDDFAALRAAQLALAALAGGVLWLWLTSLLGDGLLAATVVVVVAASGAPLYFCGRYLTEAIYLPLAWLALVAGARTLVGDGRRWAVVAGALLATVALVRPNFHYLFLALLPFLAVAAAWRPPRRGHAVLLALFIAGYGAGVAGWMVRNARDFGAPALTVGYGARALSTRLAYNRMTAQEYVAGWIYWLPDFGDSLARALFGDVAVRRLDLGHPDGLYAAGRATVRREVERATGAVLDGHQRLDGEHAQAWLLRRMVSDEPGKHAAVSLLLAWRGLFVQKYFGLVGALALLLVAGSRARTPRSLRRVLVYTAGPAGLLLAFNATVSLDIPRYNLLLVLPMSLAITELLRRAAVRLRGGRVAPLSVP